MQSGCNRTQELTDQSDTSQTSTAARRNALRASLPEGIASKLEAGVELLRRSRDEDEYGGARLPTGIPALDSLLLGGLLRGGLVELVGDPSVSRKARSCGRFTAGLSALASTTETGELAAFIDLGDHLDPQAAEAAGVELPRLLWVRPRKLKDAITSAELVIGAGFPLVVLDLGIGGRLIPPRERLHLDAAWTRLARAARAQRCALLVLSPRHVCGTAAAVVVALDASQASRSTGPEWTPEWAASPRRAFPASIPLLPASQRERLLLTGISTRLTLLKERGRSLGEHTLMRLRAPRPPRAELLEVPLARDANHESPKTCKGTDSAASLRITAAG